jgi:hypothetical protein
MTSDPAKRAQINDLISHLKEVTQDELRNGTTEQLRGSTVFSGESAKKMAALQQSTIDQINELIARPVEDRQDAVNHIKSFAAVAHTVNSVSVDDYTTLSSNPYNDQHRIELYHAGPIVYAVDTETNTVVQYGPRSLKPGESAPEFDESPALNVNQLENQAVEVVTELSSTNLADLELRTSIKENSTTSRYFFRWEDNTRELPGGIHPFIQIGLSPAGDVVSYTNTLGL